MFSSNKGTLDAIDFDIRLLRQEIEEIKNSIGYMNFGGDFRSKKIEELQLLIDKLAEKFGYEYKGDEDKIIKGINNWVKIKKK